MRDHATGPGGIMSQIPSEAAAAANTANATSAPAAKREGIPEGLWLRCAQCEEMLFRKVVEENLWVCPGCHYHFRLGARQRIEQLVDLGSFEELYHDIEPTDPLKFVNKKAFSERLTFEQQRSVDADADVIGMDSIVGGTLFLVVANSYG